MVRCQAMTLTATSAAARRPRSPAAIRVCAGFLRIAEGDWLCRDQIHPHHHWTANVAPERLWLAWYGHAQVYHQAPLYPYLVGALYALSDGNVLTVRLLQAVMGAATCVLVFLILVGKVRAIVAGIPNAVAVHIALLALLLA